MRIFMRTLASCVIAAMAASASLIAPASAAPITTPFDLRSAVAATDDAVAQTVQWRRGGWRRGGGSWIGPAIVGGAIIGGAIAATRPYGYGYGPSYYDDYAYAPGVVYAPAPTYGYRDAAYCARRFRSWDPASGTYMGYDGLRHPCP
jgi:hypothetical protein